MKRAPLDRNAEELLERGLSGDLSSETNHSTSKQYMKWAYR